MAGSFFIGQGVVNVVYIAGVLVRSKVRVTSYDPAVWNAGIWR